MTGFLLLCLLFTSWDPAQGKGRNDMDNAIQEHTQPTVDFEQAEWAILARENVLRMRSDSIRCAAPRPRVVKVQDVHPHAYKRFVPSCVELHRCDREAGCCDDESNVCSPVQKQRVSMYFYVVALAEHNGVPTIGVYGQVERLRFNNHTRCGCRKRRRFAKHPLLGQSVSATGRTAGPWSILVLISTICWTCVFHDLS